MRSYQASSSARSNALSSDIIRTSWVTAANVADRRPARALGRRVGRDELGMLGLERRRSSRRSSVELGVRHRGVVEDVVAVAVLVELGAQLLGAPPGRFGYGHRAEATRDCRRGALDPGRRLGDPARDRRGRARRRHGRLVHRPAGRCGRAPLDGVGGSPPRDRRAPAGRPHARAGGRALLRRARGARRRGRGGYRRRRRRGHRRGRRHPRGPGPGVPPATGVPRRQRDRLRRRVPLSRSGCRPGSSSARSRSPACSSVLRSPPVRSCSPTSAGSPGSSPWSSAVPVVRPRRPRAARPVRPGGPSWCRPASSWSTRSRSPIRCSSCASTSSRWAPHRRRRPRATTCSTSGSARASAAWC